MTELQKKKVKMLREAGLGYKSIEAKTGISKETIRSFVKRNNITIQQPDKNVCFNCGVHINQTPGKKQRKFCSRECGLEWWHSHSELLKKKALYNFVCPACGKEFTAYGQSKRKYCSHSCYIYDRYRGAENEVQ